MNSKEAILELICEAKSVNIDEGRICFLRNIIEKDLEALEILKDHIVYYPSDKYIMICVHKDNKDFNKVKEWLEDD